MINSRSVEAVAQSSFGKQFCRPLYDSYCFSRIPGTVEFLLTGKGEKKLPLDTLIHPSKVYDQVILLFIDGFGWRFFEKYVSKYPFLERFVKQGVCSKLTSQFPSTTAAHVTCLNTGLEVGQSGVYEWFYYEPKVDQIIAPLLFSFGGDKQPNTLKKSGILPTEIYPTATVYQKLSRKNISSYLIQYEGIVHSPYSETLMNGAKQLSYLDFSQALKHLSNLYQQTPDRKNYSILYWGEIDSMGHRYGVDSPEFEQAVDGCFRGLEETFNSLTNNPNKDIAWIVIADHGMISVNPQNTFYLNLEMPEILSSFKTNREGKVIAPAGSCRDFFLHIKDNEVDTVKEKLRKRLKNRAEVYATKELIDLGFFGNKVVSELFLDRVGNVVILPYAHEGIWWYEKHRFEQHFHGAHGGLSREEMETIFLFLET